MNMRIADDAKDCFPVHWAVHWDRLEWHPGEAVLLCTDGVHDNLSMVLLRYFRCVDETAEAR